MGVYFPNMKKPPTCSECPVKLDCGLYLDVPDGGINSNCPVIYVNSSHGDLVERKALNLFPDYKDVRNRIKQTIKATERDGRNITGVTIDLLKQTLVALDSLRSVRRYFLNAKTIVPAEGVNDNG